MRLLNLSESAYPTSPLGSKRVHVSKPNPPLIRGYPHIRYKYGENKESSTFGLIIYKHTSISQTSMQTRIHIRGIKKCNKPRLDYGMNAPSMSPPMPSVKGLVQAHCRMVKRVHKPKWQYHDLA